MIQLPSFAAIRSAWSIWWRALLGVGVAAPICFLLGQCDGRSSERARLQADQAKAALEQAGRDRAADSKLSQVKQQQAAAIAADRKEVDDATAHIPDQAPSARQRARACLELRRQAADRGAAPPAC